MSQHGTAKAGRGGSAGGGNEGGPAMDGPAADAAREDFPGGFPPGEGNVSSMFGEGRSEAEAQLYAYRDLMAHSKPPTGFPPFEELQARLNEEPSLLNPPLDEFAFGPYADDGWPERNSSEPGGSCLGFEYFDNRFLELKTLVAQRDEGAREIEQIKASLGEILVRLEKISADMPSGGALASIETKVDAVSGAIEAARQHSSGDANRISRAAEEILAASVCMQEIPARFEMAARNTVEGLGHTVAATASHAAVMAASQVAALQTQPGEIGPVERLEEELRTLNRQSRDTGERTAAALDRVNNTLQNYLGRGPAVDPGPAGAEPPRKRTGLHVPISGNSAVYKRGGTGFGATPAPEPRLDTIQLRDPPPSDPNLYEAIREADRRHSRPKPASRPQASSGAVGARPAFAGAPSFLDDEKSAPLGGIAAVAFVLLMAAAALFYLHANGRTGSIGASSAPQATAQQTPAPAQSVRTATAHKGKAAQNGPALLASADDSRGSQPASEELDTLVRAARNGDRDAQFRVGERFLDGAALDGGLPRAASWFERAADQGHSEAQFVLASMYERGAGVEKNEKKAIDYYRLAASAGHVRAMHNLGAMLLKNASAESYRDAAGWFQRAAEHGFADSQYNLALLYEHGLGIEQDLSRAYQWYVAAAKSGVKEAAVQADRLRRTLPSAENAKGAPETIQAGSWKPQIVNTKKNASIGGSAGQG